MKFIDIIKLVIKGKPIVSSHKILMPEESFKQIIDTKLQRNDDFNPFSVTKKRFIGYFYGYKGYKLSIRLKISLLRGDTISNSIWIHGEIRPEIENEFTFKVTINRTSFAKNGERLLRMILSIAFLVISFQTLRVSDFEHFLFFNGTIIFFYLFATFIIVLQAKDQIRYFEKYFFSDIDKE